MKTVLEFNKLIIIFLFLFVPNVWGQTLAQNYNNGQNYYGNNFQKNLDLVNRVFNTDYTTYVNQNPGNYNYDFLLSPWPSSTSPASSTHKGIDYRAQQPFDLYSPLTGVVVAVGGSTGKICIYNSQFNMTFVFIHCSISNVSVGQNITLGQLVGKTGSVGADSPHLHVELRSGSQNFAATSDSSPTTSFDPRIVMDFFPLCSTTPPITTTPSNAQTNVGIPVFFNWDDVSGTNPQYRIQVSTTSSGWTATNGFTTALVPSGNVKVNFNTDNISQYSWSQYLTTDNPFTPQPNTTYYYTVKSFVCGQSSNYSAIKSFTTGCLATTPVLISPTNSQTNVINPINFDWQDDSGTNPLYRIQVSTVNSGWTVQDGFTTNTSPTGNVVVNQNTSNVSAYQWSGGQSGTTYYWTVRTNSCNHSSPYSPVRSFTIGNNTPCNPPTVTLNTPANGTTYNIGQTISLQWTGVENGCAIQDYQIEITAPNGNSTSPTQTTTSFNFTATTAGVGTWQWRVRARNINGVYGNYTSSRTFIISQTTTSYTISTSSNPSIGGLTTGNGTYSNGSNVNVTASANSGYIFSNWTENNTIVSTNASYPFTISSNRNLVANFSQNQTATCLNCPSYDFSTSINSSWGNNSSSILSDGCKVYRFLAVPNKIYTFKTGCNDGATANFDTYLELKDANCDALSNNDDGCSNSTSKIEWVCNYLSTNWIYLKVRGYNSSEFGSYTLAYNESPSLGLNENEILKNNINIYPNPTKNIINIDSKEKIICKIEIIDIQGRLIFKDKYNNNKIEINSSSFENGTYLIKVYFENEQLIYKIIKN